MEVKMEDEFQFDLEHILGKCIITPITQVFYKTRGFPLGSAVYQEGGRLTKEAREATQEAIKYAIGIHKKYQQN
jgi:hypothetical protein